MIHRLKIREDFADAVVDGRKTFEIRENDRGFQAGDLVEFTAVERSVPMPVTLHSHPINDKIYEITYVLNGDGLEDGYVVFGIREAVVE